VGGIGQLVPQYKPNHEGSITDELYFAEDVGRFNITLYVSYLLKFQVEALR
jgi:hypothetical protein